MDGLEATEAPVEVTDQATEADVTPAVESFTDFDPAAAPEGDMTSEWLQERYRQMQGDYTRKTQEIAGIKGRQEELDFLDALRSDPETQRAVMDELRELLDGADEDATVDDSEAHDPIQDRLEALEQERAAEKAQALATEILSHINDLASEAGVELDDEDLNTLFERATGGESIDKDFTAKAFQDFQARRTSQHDKWLKGYLKSKESPTAQVPNGSSATDKPDLNNRDTRLGRFAAILQGQG